MADGSLDYLDVEGIKVPICYKQGRGQTLIVNFHGALNRSRRDVPFFIPFFRRLADVHQVAIADPGLERYGRLPACWYLGWEGGELWKSLGLAIRRFSERVGCSFRVYTGGSSGGFAALLYGYEDAGSVVVCYNPQTNLLAPVYEQPTSGYFSAAWPNYKDKAALGQKVPLQLSHLYSNGFPNTVVFLQSAGDAGHLLKQAIPFLSNLPKEKADDIVINIGFEGMRDHGGSIQRESVRRYVEAASQVGNLCRGRSAFILDAVYTMELANGRSTSKIKKDTPFLREDIRFADRLAQLQLGDGNEQ